MPFQRILIAFNKLTTSQDSRTLFRSILGAVFLFVLGYSMAYLVLGARFVSLMQAIGALLWVPIAFELDRKGKIFLSRFILISIGILAIYFADLGLKVDTGVEYFFIPSIMATLILFESHRKFEITLGIFIPFLAWIATRWGPKPELSEYWSPSDFPYEIFKSINFAGSFALAAILLKVYAYHLAGIKQVVVEELEKSKKMELQLENAQRLANIGNWEFDLKTQQVFWSKEQYKIFGLSPMEPSKHYEAYRKRYPPEDLSRLDLAIAEAIQYGKPFEFEHRIILDNGETKFILGKGEPVKDSSGNVIRLFGTGQDITEQKRIAKTLSEQQMKLTSSAKMASLGEMAGGIAHEINNPLAIIQGKATQLIKKLDRGEQNSVVIKNDLEKISATAERIAKIIRGLRTFSRNAENDPMIEISLTQIADDLLELCQEKFKNSDIELEVSVPKDIQIQCRPSQIGQVLLNLVNNSFDAIQGQKKKWVKLLAIDNGPHVDILVVDSGTGISDDVVEKMMQPFFTTKELGKGTGLGLSISIGIIENHGGKLTYEKNNPNTCFRLWIPKSQSQTHFDAA